MSDLKRKRFNPSSAAFLKDGEVHTKSSNGCLRNRQISHNLSQKYKALIDPIYQEIGKIDEDRYFEVLQKQHEHASREVELVYEIENLTYSGRADFIIYNGNKDKIKIIEKKSCISPKSRLKYIRKGEPNVNHLAQLISYLTVTGVSQGELVYDYYEQDQEKSFHSTETRSYIVNVDDSGDIYVDGDKFKFTAADSVAHLYASMQYVDLEKIAPRPFDAYTPYKSPCHFCEFNNSCDKFDMRSIDKTTLIKEAEEELKYKQTLPQRVVEIPQLKIKKPAKVKKTTTSEGKR